MMKNILTLTLLSSLLCVGAYAQCTRNSNETVTCSESKLMWQDNSEAKTIEKSWSDAIKYCEDLNFAGYSDWRLPNKNELLSIVDRTKYNPAIYGAFKNIAMLYNDYWSSTSSAFRTSSAWVVNFIYGDMKDYDTFDYAKKGSNYVRCVRAGQ